jgi:hypothetical protein
MREFPPADPFPAEALGDVLGPAAVAIQGRVQAPLAICSQSVLAVATLATQAHADVELPTGQRRPISNFYLTIAATGERKSAVDGQALLPVRRREAGLRESYEVNRSNYENDQAAWEKAREEVLKKGKGERGRIKDGLDSLGSAPQRPLEPLLTCPEPTYEGIVKLFSIGSPSLGIFAAEGGQFIGGHGMSDDAKLRTAAGLSAVWDGEPIKRVRSGEGVTVLPGRRLSMHLMAQPEVAQKWLGDHLLVDQGLLSRVLPTAPDMTSGAREWREPLPEWDVEIRKYESGLLDIFERVIPLASGTKNQLEPRVIPLCPIARDLWIEFYKHIEQRLGSDGDLEPVRGLANKLPEHAARIATVLTLIRDFEAGQVGSEEMRGGIALGDHYITEALRLVGLSKVKGELRLAQRLLDWLVNKWKEPMVSLPDIYQRGLNAIGDQTTARKLVEILQEHGWLTKKEGGGTVAGVRRRDVWIIVRGTL